MASICSSDDFMNFFNGSITINSKRDSLKTNPVDNNITEIIISSEIWIFYFPSWDWTNFTNFLIKIINLCFISRHVSSDQQCHKWMKTLLKIIRSTGYVNTSIKNSSYPTVWQYQTNPLSPRTANILILYIHGNKMS